MAAVVHRTLYRGDVRALYRHACLSDAAPRLPPGPGSRYHASVTIAEMVSQLSKYLRLCRDRSDLSDRGFVIVSRDTTSRLVANPATQLHSYTATQLHSYTATQLHSYTATQLHSYTATQQHHPILSPLERSSGQLCCPGGWRWPRTRFAPRCLLPPFLAPLGARAALALPWGPGRALAGQAPTLALGPPRSSRRPGVRDFDPLTCAFSPKETPEFISP